MEFNKQFRNRFAYVRNTIIKSKSIDAILLILSFDSMNSLNVHKFANWLLFGYSGNFELEEMQIDQIFNETFLVIQEERIYVFSSNSTKDFFYNLFSKIGDIKIEYDFTSKKEEDNSDYIQILKISKFMENTYRCKRIGIPLLNKEKINIRELEKWPLINAYGLDSLGEGFFTLRHDIVDINPSLEILYSNIDLSSCINLICVKAHKLEKILSDFFTLFDREKLDRRLDRSESSLNENQELDFQLIDYYNLKKSKFAYYSDLPDSRVLVGTNTNKKFDESCSSDSIYKSKLYRIYLLVTYEYKIPSLHLTYENFDATTGIRFARTYFLFNLQFEYPEYNQEQMIIYRKSFAYCETFYLFNIYFKLVKYTRENNIKIISGELKLEHAKSAILSEVNDFIEKEYCLNNPQSYNESFKYLLKKENILINFNEYKLTCKSLVEDENKIISLRIEINDIVSVNSNKSLGAVVFCDSFLISMQKIYNLTGDIIPFKYFNTSANHFSGGEHFKYNLPQMLKSVSECKYSDFNIKGLIFYRNSYNIAYLFPGYENTNENNQMFVSLNGKLSIYGEFIVIFDNSLGYIVIDHQNIQSLSYKNENLYTIMLISVKDSSKLPLSGIIKSEILIYFNDKSSTVKIDAFTYFRGKLGLNIFKHLTLEKEEEYELAITTIAENEYENLNYISNNFNITNILDQLKEMCEAEFEAINNEPTMTQLNQNTVMSSITSSENSIKKKLLFIFGTISDNLSLFANSLQDIARSIDKVSNVIFPPLWVINDEKEFYMFYVNAIVKNKCNYVIVVVQREIKIINFINRLTEYIDHNDILSKKTFFDNFLILNICYSVKYDTLIKNKQKDLCTHLYNLVEDKLVNYILIDEGNTSKEKVEQYNKMIFAINSNSITFNTRSLTRNMKEMKKIFEIKENLFVFKMRNSQIEETNEEHFFRLKFKIERHLLEYFLQFYLNSPLEYIHSICNWKENSENKKYLQKMTDEEFQSELIQEVEKVKCKAQEPIIEKVTGYVKLLHSDKISDTVYKVNGFYKLIEINEMMSFPKIEEIGLLLQGKNIKRNIEYLTNFLEKLSGDIPRNRPYRTKADLTEEEIFNLNLVNFERNLPDGWFTEGPVFLDEFDNRYAHHPNLPKFIDEFLEICNSAVDEHNKQISEEIKLKYLI